MHTNTSVEELKAQVIEPQNIENWGYGFYQHKFHREISILSNRLDDDLITKLKSHALSHRDSDFRHRLAGQIAEEYETPFYDAPELQSELNEFLKQQVQNFLGQQPTDEFEWFAWTNISKPGEFNPVHAHQNCVLSWVLYLDIPEAIREEYYEPITTMPSKGLISFYSNYSPDHMTFNPRTGDFFLFTANHRHAVGAFYTEGAERISLAGNITKL
jgi:hypothetical protein